MILVSFAISIALLKSVISLAIGLVIVGLKPSFMVLLYSTMTTNIIESLCVTVNLIIPYNFIVKLKLLNMSGLIPYKNSAKMSSFLSYTGMSALTVNTTNSTLNIVNSYLIQVRRPYNLKL